MSPTSTFKYRPLDSARHEIRLLQIQPTNDPSEELICTVVHKSLDDSPEYEALSYTWDGNDFSEGLILDGHPFSVTANLKTALLALRDRALTRTVWADAICIDQSSQEERSREVRRMLDIYMAADRVCVWLGAASDDSGLALDHLGLLGSEWAVWTSRPPYLILLRRTLSSLVSTIQFLLILTIQVLPRFPRYHFYMVVYYLNYMGIRGWRINHWLAFCTTSWVIVRSTIMALQLWWKAKPWSLETKSPAVDQITIKALAHLFGRPWFTRTWIVQELIGAKEAVVLCGARSMSISCLTDAIDLISYRIDSHESKSPYIDCQYERFALFFGILRMRHLDPTLSFISYQRQSLLFMINQFSSLDATDPRDKVYGFLGLATEDIVPDYDKPISRVYIETARTLIEANGNLDVLRACLYTGSVTGLPSWVPDWTVKEVRSVSGMAYWREPYALGDCVQQPVATFSSDLHHMTVKGIVVAVLQGEPETKILTTARPGPGNPNTRIIRVLYQIMGISNQLIWLLLTHFPGMRLLLSYLVDRNPGGCGYVFKYFLLASRMDHPGPIQFPRTSEAHQAFLSKEGREMAFVKTWNCVPRDVRGELIEGWEQWGNKVNTYAEDTRAGDLVVMLLGAKVPFLVRKISEDDSGSHEDSKSSNGYMGDNSANLGKYLLAGPVSFSNTIMDTFGWESTKKRYLQAEQKEFQLEEFVLV